MARVRKSVSHFLQISFVFALGFLALLSIQGISGATSNALISYSLAKLPAGEANLTVNSTQVISSPDQRQAINKYLQKKLEGISGGVPTPEVIYSELVDAHGVGFFYGAVDQFSTKIRLTTGKFPGICTPNRCEVLQIGGNQKLSPRPVSFGLKVVGHGEISDGLIFAGTMGPPAGTALLLANGLNGGNSLPHLEFSHGSDGWVVKIDPNRINKLGVDAFSARVVAFEDQLSIDYPNLVVTWPQDALSSAGDQGKSLQGKLTLLKFAVVTLLLAYAVLMAFRRRKDHSNFRAALSRIGTPKRTLAWEIYLESAAPIIFGVVLALLISLVLPKILALFNFQLGVSDLYSGGWSLLLLGFVLFFISIGVITSRDFSWRWTQVICGSLSLLLFALYLAQSHVNDSRYLMVPILYTATPLLMTFLLLQAAQKFWRAERPTSFILMKEFFSLWLGVASMVALTALLAVLAVGYSSGLSQQISEQARNEVPLDISLITGSNLIRPLDLASAAEFAHLQTGASAFPILRTGTSIRGQSSTADSLSLIGLPPKALALSTPSLAQFAESRNFQSSAPEPGIGMGNAKKITVNLLGIPKEIDLLGWFRSPRGTHLSQPFSGQGNLRSLELAGLVPRGSYLVAFEFRESSNYLSRRLHANGEGNYSIPQLKGIGSITRLLFDRTEVQLPAATWKIKNFPYLFDGQSIYLSPARDIGIPSVVTDPTTAKLAVNGELTLLTSGNRYMQVRVGKVEQSFPSAGDRFVLMELDAMQAEIAKSDLGAIDPIELWIKSPHPDAFIQKLTSSLYQGVTVKNRLALERIAAQDPNSVGLLASYRIALALALLIALLIGLGALPNLYREGRGVLTHLEIAGYGPQPLRRAVRNIWRTAILAGIAVGALLGSLTSRIFISPLIPVLQVGLVLLLSYLLFELIGSLISRPFFKENLPVF